MSDDSINRDNRYLTLLDFELNPTLMSWIQRCSSLKPDDIEHHSRAYRELDAERLEIIAFFSRPLEEILAGFAYMREFRRNLTLQTQLESMQKTAKEQERALFERKKEIFETKFKGTKWDDLFWDLLYDGGEWEGDEEGIKNIKVELERLRKEFIEEFGHEPEEEYNV